MAPASASLMPRRVIISVTYVENVRRYYEILMWLDSHETLTSREFGPPSGLDPAG